MNQLDSNVGGGRSRSLLDLTLSAADSVRQSIGIVGLAKNCGKTTALGALIMAAQAGGIPVGATSCGRDGELHDAVTGLPKPPIPATRGAIVALAEACIGRTSARLEVVERLGVHTTAGEVVVARVIEPGPVEIIGCNHGRDLALSVHAMHRHGARLVLVDGAAGRTFLASPDIVDCVILATGAALEGSMDEVADATGMAVHLFMPADPPVDLAALARPVVASGDSGIVRRYGTMDLLPWRTLLGREAQVTAAHEHGDRALVCGRSVGDGLLRELAAWLWRCRRDEARIRLSDDREKLSDAEPFRVVAADPSRIAACGRSVAAFEAAGGELCVLRKAGVIAVTTNPTSPWSGSFDPGEFALEVSKRVGGIPVYDVVAGHLAFGGDMLETRP